ncbi:MAG: DUF3291 domain-containing protein [Gemmatimonadales bacterium]
MAGLYGNAKGERRKSGVGSERCWRGNPWAEHDTVRAWGRGGDGSAGLIDSGETALDNPAVHLAQYNIAWIVAPLDDPVMADFTGNIAAVNRLAEEAPGFVWRHQTDDGDSTSIRVRGDDRIIINFSVWESAEALFQFAFYSGHADYYRRRNDWFTHEDAPFAVLWWVPAGHEPTVEEAEAKLAYLKTHGASAQAFTFRSRFPAPGTVGGG